jgi:hypothetical protein
MCIISREAQEVSGGIEEGLVNSVATAAGLLDEDVMGDTDQVFNNGHYTCFVHSITQDAYLIYSQVTTMKGVKKCHGGAQGGNQVK